MSVSLSENGYTIKGIAPPDLKDRPEFAPAFWGWVVALGLKAKDRELSQGLDKDGRPLRAITAETRRHRRSAMTPTGRGDPSAPPLMPGRQLSRTRSLLTGRAYPDRAEFWWRFDAWTGDSWAAVLEVQKRRGRDVFGLSPQAQKRVQAQAWQLWERLKVGRPIPALPLPSAAVAAGPVVGPSTRPRGGMTIAEIERHYRAPAAPIPGRPGVNVLLRHVFGTPEGPVKAAGGVVVPRPPKPRPIERQRVAMAPRAKPEPPKPAPKPLTFEESLAARLKVLPAGETPQERKARRLAIAELVEAHAQAGPMGAFHGMADAESFRTLRYRGWNLHFSGPIDMFSGVVQEMENFERRGVTFPDRLRAATRDIYYTQQANKDDAKWVERYGLASLTQSIASGGEGVVVACRSQAIGVATLAHESGHNLASSLYGSTTPRGDYRELLRTTSEPPVSAYARVHPGEDFAESASMYVDDPDKMKRIAPERYRIIHRLMTDPNYAG